MTCVFSRNVISFWYVACSGRTGEALVKKTVDASGRIRVVTRW